MSGVDIVRSFLQQAVVRGVRSTVMNPLEWLIAMLLAGIALCLYYQAPDWLLILLAIFVAMVVTMFIVMYLYFALKTPDSLRSERFTLSKMIIEKSVKGDNLIGLIEPKLQVEEKLVPTPSVEPEEEEEKIGQ